MNKLFRRKPIDAMLGQRKETGLKRSLGALDLAMLGVGAIIGTGIFVLTGVAAAEHAGPALVISFILSGLACAFAALCYAEFASTVPIAGSGQRWIYGPARLYYHHDRNLAAGQGHPGKCACQQYYGSNQNCGRSAIHRHWCMVC